MKLIKTILSMAFALFICISMALSINAIGIDPDSAVAFAEEFLSEYYYAKHQCAEYDFSRYIQSPKLLEFATKKAEADQYAFLIRDTDYMQNYDVSFTLKSIETYEYYAILNIAAEVSFNYADMSEVRSSMGDEHIVIVSEIDGGIAVSDWYELMNPYDIFIRGERFSLSDPNWWSVATISGDDLTEKLEIKNEQVKQWYLDMIERPSSAFTVVDDEPEPMTVVNTLNKSAMVTWAL